MEVGEQEKTDLFFKTNFEEILGQIYLLKAHSISWKIFDCYFLILKNSIGENSNYRINFYYTGKSKE